MTETDQGTPSASSELVNVGPPAGPPVPNTVTAYAAFLAVEGKTRRETLAKKIVEGKETSRFPNAVQAEVDVEDLLDERFLADALLELRARRGILVSGDDPLSFEPVFEETLRTEAGALYEPIKVELDQTDPTRQVLLLCSKPIQIAGGDKKTRQAFHLVRIARNRAHVDRKGIALDLPNPSDTDATIVTEIAQ